MPSPFIPQFSRSNYESPTYGSMQGWGAGPNALGSGTSGLGDDYLSVNPQQANPMVSMSKFEPMNIMSNYAAPAQGMAPAAGSGLWGGIGDWAKSSGMMGSTDPTTGAKTDGWGGMALGGISAGANLFMGMKQYGMAKDQLAESKRQYEAGHANQVALTNGQLEDRQNARNASGSGYMSTADYMAKNRVA